MLDGEVPRHDRVHREHQRSGQRGQIQIGPRVVPPLVVGALPADRAPGVDHLAPARHLVAHRCHIGDEPEHQEGGGNRQIGGDGEHVPDQRRFEVGPEITLIGIRQQPVENPLAANVNDGKKPGRHDREHRHGLGRAVDRRTPGRAKEKQDRGNQRAGVPDTHPEDEGGDVHAPENRRLVAGMTQPVLDEDEKRQNADQKERYSPGKQQQVAAARRP